MRKAVVALVTGLVCAGFLNAAELDVPQKVKALLVKTGASW